jgi:formylglycine-generating enzyme required for sulfatase activity
MVHVPGGEAWIGTDEKELAALLKGRSQGVRVQFEFERPRHRVRMNEFWMDRTEVTNAQYYAYLQQARRATYDTSKGSSGNLVEAVADLLGGLPKPGAERVLWRQLAESNKDALQKALPNLKWPDEFQYAPLPPGLVLHFYDRRPPDGWPSTKPADAMLDHPVTSVSYNDFVAFAEWSGKHIPTEEEWEWAARGPDALPYPWGRKWFYDSSHCRWGGANDLGPEEPAPMPADSLHAGASWCGCVHMVGNVAEWTSSPFRGYPGMEKEHPYMGDSMRVIRGGTGLDKELLVLRAAARNWVGSGPDAPPRLGNRFSWVGCRLAWYPEAARNQVGPVIGRVARHGRVKAPDVDASRLGGAVAEDFAPPGVAVSNGVHVLGRTKSVVLVPLTSVIAPEDASRARLRTSDGLRKESAGLDPILLAVFHTDVGLERVWVRTKAKEPERGGRGRGKPLPPSVESGSVAAGTYVIGLWHDRVVVLTPRREFVCFLTGSGKKPTIAVHKNRLEEPGRTTVTVDEEIGIVKFHVEVPLGTEPNDRDLHVVVDGIFSSPDRDLETPNGWRSGLIRAK